LKYETCRVYNCIIGCVILYMKLNHKLKGQRLIRTLRAFTHNQNITKNMILIKT